MLIIHTHQIYLIFFHFFVCHLGSKIAGTDQTEETPDWAQRQSGEEEEKEDTEQRFTQVKEDQVEEEGERGEEGAQEGGDKGEEE